jgi:ATP-dependent DNA helicase DinG
VSKVLTYLGVDGPVSRKLADYEERAEQLELARAIEQALGDRTHLMAEAGTGVGKSFAYLLPAVLHATGNQADGPVVVSTRTIALQQQLETKDLPFLKSVLPMEWLAMTAVGRNNYLCLRRMHMAQRGERGVLFEDAHRQAQLAEIVDWSLSTRDGTRMELPDGIAPEVWEEVHAEQGNCLHRACAHYRPCHYQRSRRRMHTAQILVVNHALYMADVALRMVGASYLPPHRVVVFDEAHHLERVATESLGLRLSQPSILWHLRRLHPRRSPKSLLALHGSPQALLLVEELRSATAEFFTSLQQHLDQGTDGDGLALEDKTLDDPLSELLFELAGQLTASAARSENLEVRMELQARAAGLSRLRASVTALCRGEDKDLVRWIESERRSPVLRAAPLDISDALNEHVFGEGRTAVLVSATMGPGEDSEFTWMRKRLGLDRATTLRLGSPFDFVRNVELVLEEALPDPGQGSEFLREAAERTLDHLLANGGRALVLCTSWDSVRRFAQLLREPLEQAEIPLLVQGQAPLNRLLQTKARHQASVLLGTDSIWEGIDIPGEALTLVVIVRLPFTNPTHPLTQARLRAIQQRGGDPFLEHSLPEAVLKFRQGFGRLVRSHRDHGKVVVLDPRSRTRAYGRHFLAALPVEPQSDSLP